MEWSREISRLLIVALLISGLAMPLPSIARDVDPCSHYLFNGDTYLGELDCPELPSIDETGFVRSKLPGALARPGAAGLTMGTPSRSALDTITSGSG